MDWRKILMILILVALVSLIFTGVTKDYLEYKEEKKGVDELKAQIKDIVEENSGVNKEIDYYSDNQNLEKELKSRFNYKREGEEVLIIIPEE